MQHTSLPLSRAPSAPTVSTPQPSAPSLTRAIAAARDALWALQQPDGHWCGELEGDTILGSEYIMLMYYVGRGSEPKVRKAARYLERTQQVDGGWSLYPGGPSEVSVSVKNYFALKLLGRDPESDHMRRARAVIVRLGGIAATNSFTKFYLAIFGQYPWGRCPAVPPEIILLPNWSYFNIYETSSWSRAIFVPLSIVWACKPRCPVPDHAGISELAVDAAPRPRGPQRDLRERWWRSLFLVLDRVFKAAEWLRLTPLRRLALARAETWITDRLERSDGLAAIFPPIVNSVFAFHCLGHDLEGPLIQAQLEELAKLEIEDADSVRLQPCRSPVWDTVLTIKALIASGSEPDDERLLRAADWLVDREVRVPGDWQVKNPGASPGGWYFEYANEPYPDCDDTAEALIALSSIRFPDDSSQARLRAALTRAVRWQSSMQNRDGGWAAFDRGCDKEILKYVPFADHNAMIDPSTADITARSIRALLRNGVGLEDRRVLGGRDFLLASQQPDGTWYGRWGCNYLYGTWLAVSALAELAGDRETDAVRRAVAWIRAQQNDDGGWGELPASYDDPALKGQGPSTPSQTAWALLALIAAGETDSEAVVRGVDYLLATQQADGSWQDEYWTGTGFPCVFYLRYHLYATYFSLEALGTYRTWAER